MRQKGIMVVVSGFSGVGKGTIMKLLMEKYDNYAFSVSATTREPRKEEVNGREYFFITDEEFDTMVREDRFIEYARYVKHSYGTLRSYVEEKMAEGKDVILEIETQGALNVKKKYPETLLVYVIPPSAEELKRRLTERGTESAEVIEARLKQAIVEADQIDSYDYVLVNDTVPEAMERLHSLIQSQHLLTVNNQSEIERMKEELKTLTGK